MPLTSQTTWSYSDPLIFFIFADSTKKLRLFWTVCREAFSPFGILKAVNLDIDPLTGRHKGYAYVEYDLPEGFDVNSNL